jgi:hypothetical protein
MGTDHGQTYRPLSAVADTEKLLQPKIVQHTRWMFKKAVQRGRSERKAEAYAVGTLRP